MLQFTDEKLFLNRHDLMISTFMAIVMGSIFIKVGGLPLLITFVPALFVSVGTISYMFIKKIEFPKASVFVPLFFTILAWQFIHFNEEFLTGFYIKFPVIYGSEAYSVEKFVSVNMISYFVFASSCILIYTKKLRFLILPTIFFIIYGAIGNAIAHTWWVIWFKGYFPGFFTALLYWVLGPLVLAILIGSKKIAWLIVLIFALILIPLTTFTIV